jgi:hypothetical protein
MFSLKKIIIPILLVLCFESSTLQAEDRAQAIALEVYPQWYSHEDFVVQGNIGIEKAFQSSNFAEFYTKTSVAYALNEKWSLHGGLGLHYTDYKAEDNNFEIRPFQGVSHFILLTEKWNLSSYLRLEERFQYNTNTRDREDTLRLRLRFRTTYEFNPLSIENSWHKLLLGVEGFKSYTEDEVDNGIQDNYNYESRMTVGVERSLSDKNKLRFELTWKYQVPPDRIAESSASTFYFKVQYYPVWGGLIGNRLSNRGIDD